MKGAALVLAGAILGAAVVLAILAVMIPARLFGVSDEAVEYSVSASNSQSCDRVAPGRWRCEVFDGQASLTHTYSVVVSPNGCWKATSQSAEPLDGCLGLWDYIRP